MARVIRRCRQQGHDQARLVCARLAGAGLAAIYVSSMRRTAQTAAPLAAELGS